MILAGACALASMGMAGCSSTESWFGGTASSTAASPSGETGSAGAGSSDVGTSGMSASGSAAGASGGGTGMVPPTTGRPLGQRAGTGAGRSDDAGERNRAFYPGTLSGEGMWTGDSDAPGAN